jgi:hypothetical protein
VASTTPFGTGTGARLASTVLFLATVMSAGHGVEAASVTVSWTAPTTNANGTRLTDLAGYRLYLDTSPPTCPGGSFHAVASPTTTPPPGQIVSTRVKGLKAHATYFARITSVDLSGNESGCSGQANGIAPPDFTVTPPGNVTFGSVAVNGTVERRFTVHNTSSASISGGASVAAPFSIVSGASFSLASGDQQAVVVGFRPTTLGSFAASVTFVASGDTVVLGVSGSARTAGPSAKLSVKKNGTGTGTVTSSPAGIACGTACTTTVATGAPVELTTHPAAGSIFAGWSGACSGGGACALTMYAASTAIATFDKLPAAPSAGSLSPAAAVAGRAALTLTVNGNGFVAASVVRWQGVPRATTFVSARQLRAAISAADLATPGRIPVTVLTPSPGGGTSGPVTFTVTAPAERGATPPAPRPPSVKRRTADLNGVTFTIAWAVVGEAAFYRYVAAFVDGSAPQQGTVSGRAFSLQMPYHVSGAASGAIVCIRSVSGSGRQSADQACSTVPVPARPEPLSSTAAQSSPLPPP